MKTINIKNDIPVKNLNFIKNIYQSNCLPTKPLNITFRIIYTKMDQHLPLPTVHTNHSFFQLDPVKTTPVLTNM